MKNRKLADVLNDKMLIDTKFNLPSKTTSTRTPRINLQLDSPV